MKETTFRIERMGNRGDGIALHDGETYHIPYALPGETVSAVLTEGRAEAVRRAGEAALLVAASGGVAIVSLVSPYEADRERVRARHAASGVPFAVVHVDAPLAVAESRDPKGLYKRARAGELERFTGVSDPYEPPIAPELRLATEATSVDACVASVVALAQRLARPA